MKGLLCTIVTVIVFIFPFCFQAAFCGSSPNVPIDNHVYRDIDQLVAAGLIKDAIYGQRPWSRHEIARLIKEARGHLPELGSVVSFNPNLGLRIMTEDTINNLEREYRDELAERPMPVFRPLQQATLDLVYLDSPFRAVPENNGLGSIKASINPLISYREGRRYADGGTFAVESEHWARTSEHFSFYARPRLEVLNPRDESSDANFRAQSLYGKLNYKNVELQVGRDSLIWGHGEYGGVLASSNARNMDMVKVSNDTPFVLPSFFKYLGPSKYTVFVARLDSEYVLPNAYVYGFAASFKPLPNVEMGVKHQTTVGGEGSPSVSFGKLVREFFFQRGDAGVAQETMDNREGFDIRLQIPKLRNAVVYAEGVFEDFGRKSFWPQFTEQMGFVSGFYFPRLTNDGSNDLRIELEHSPAAYGRHFFYKSGLTLDDRLRGSELGPDGKALHLVGRHFSESGTQLRAEAHFENRRTDNYTQTPISNGGIDRVIRTTAFPVERRFRFLFALHYKLNNQLTIRPSAAYEHVWNYGSAPLAHKNNLVGALSLVLFGHD